MIISKYYSVFYDFINAYNEVINGFRLFTSKSVVGLSELLGDLRPSSLLPSEPWDEHFGSLQLVAAVHHLVIQQFLLAALLR